MWEVSELRPLRQFSNLQNDAIDSFPVHLRGFIVGILPDNT